MKGEPEQISGFSVTLFGSISSFSFDSGGRNQIWSRICEWPGGFITVQRDVLALITLGLYKHTGSVCEICENWTDLISFPGRMSFREEINENHKSSPSTKFTGLLQHFVLVKAQDSQEPYIHTYIHT